MRRRLVAFSDRIRSSALAIPVAVVAAAMMLIISELAFHGANSQLRQLVDMGKARVQLLNVMQRLTDAESGSRGHVLAGGDEYLVPYQSARQDAQDGLARLEALYQVIGDAQAEGRRQRVAELVNSKLSELEEVLRLHKSGRYEAALEMIRSGIGRDLMNQLRQEIGDLLDEQNARIATGLDGMYHTLLLSRLGVSAMTAISLLVLVMFVRQGRLLDAILLERQAAVQAERDRLEQEVLQRTDELTELARHLQTAREDERARLARDLHDELGALLTAAKLDVARMRPKLQQSAPELLPRLTHLTEFLNSGIALKRRIIEDLRPSTLSSLGLCPALEILCTEFAEGSGLVVEVDLQPVRLEPGAELTVFRLVQEALTNITKYAQASRVHVRLKVDDDQAWISVTDDGVGFDPHQIVRSSHGLLGMRYRVESVLGQLRLDTAPGRGTTISAHLPQRGAPASA